MEELACEETRWQQLPAYLQFPANRLHEYTRWIKKILKKTLDDHPDTDNLFEALDLATELVDIVFDLLPPEDAAEA